MTHDVIVLLAVLGVVGQVLAAALIVVGALALARRPRPARDGAARGSGATSCGRAFVVAAIATGGSLFFSQVAGFVPCELCWFQRICMYPLSILTLFARAATATTASPATCCRFPVVGACVSVYHLLIENQVIAEPSACRISAPGGLRDEVDQRVRLHDDPDARRSPASSFSSDS